MGLTEEQICELIACKDLDTFCAKIGHHPLKMVFDLKQIMYPTRADIIVYMLWSVIYNFDKTYFIIENSITQCRETMRQFYQLAARLPMWMQPEPWKMQSACIDFANGCKLRTISNSTNLRGWTISGAMISTDIVGEKSQKLCHDLIPAIISNRPIIEFNNGAEIWDT